ncbi:uncharacterized protein LOC113363408 [Ctenocephalides felis]|uniref:uncharacterized protein LOC113363408 n=1 Tax=Ctenocephalides felis TaxID=7515 RepID=UPI000E6E5A65|nr:uncharacterized protein LOC113363408 [Ctenocephalides felis]
MKYFVVAVVIILAVQVVQSIYHSRVINPHIPHVDVYPLPVLHEVPPCAPVPCHPARDVTLADAVGNNSPAAIATANNYVNVHQQPSYYKESDFYQWVQPCPASPKFPHRLCYY